MAKDQAQSGAGMRARLHNGVQMPMLGLGTWRTSEGEQVENSVRWALELGYRHIDTAMMYKNERGIGKAVRDSRVPREQVFITTKLWNEDQRQGPDAVRRAFDDSLRLLGMDYIDLYLIHWPVKGCYARSWQVLEEIYATKRARAIGVSNFMIHHVKDVMGSLVPMVNQVEMHPWLLQRDLLNFSRQNGIVHEAWSPLAQGKVFEIPELGKIAARIGRTVAQVVLRWNLQHGVVTIPKSVTRQRIQENAGLFDFALSAGDMAAIDALDRNQRIGPDPDNFTF
jgi:diketogulonate reductase-like aldo/keto reductase